MKTISTLVILSALVAAASAQTQQTPAPTTVAPVTKAPATPAPTTAETKKPATTPAASTTKPAATPAASTTKPAATPAATSTTKYDPVKGCWSVSVERDATYCITGPICSGNGKAPAGTNCPKKGDVAIERCLPYLASYTASGKCVAPVDSTCQVIHTGAWGCVLKGDNSTGGAGGKTPAPTKNGTAGGNSTTNGTKSSSGTIQAPTKLTNLATGVETTSASAAVVGAVAAVAALAAAAIGTVLYKKNQAKSAESMVSNETVDVVTP